MGDLVPMDITRRALWHGLATSLLWALTLSGCGILTSSSPPPCALAANTRDASAADSRIVRSLHRQLQEREKRLTELQFRLDALKRIDQDRQNQRRVSRPSATITPLE